MIDALFSCQGARFRRAARKLILDGASQCSLLGTSSNGRPCGRQKRKGTPLVELVQLVRSCAPVMGRHPLAVVHSGM